MIYYTEITLHGVGQRDKNAPGYRFAGRDKVAVEAAASKAATHGWKVSSIAQLPESWADLAAGGVFTWVGDDRPPERADTSGTDGFRGGAKKMFGGW